MKNNIIIIFCIGILCIMAAGCGSPFDVNTPVDVKPVDSTSHQYANAKTALFILSNNRFGQAVGVVDSLGGNSIQIDTAFNARYININSRIDFSFLPPLETECKTIIRGLDIHLSDFAVTLGDSVELLQAPETGNGIRVHAVVLDRKGGGGGKPRDVVYETGGRDSLRVYASAVKSTGRNIVCQLTIELPCDDDKPFPYDDKKSIVVATYFITY